MLARLASLSGCCTLPAHVSTQFDDGMLPHSTLAFFFWCGGRHWGRLVLNEVWLDGGPTSNRTGRVQQVSGVGSSHVKDERIMKGHCCIVPFLLVAFWTGHSLAQPQSASAEGGGRESALGLCALSSAVVQETIFVEHLEMDKPNIKGRFLSFSVDDLGAIQAIRIVVKDVTESHHEHLIGSTWWAQPKERVSESGGSRQPLPGFPNIWVSRLGCEPHFEDWNGSCIKGSCQGGLNASACVNKKCAGGPDDGNTCAQDSDCPGAACSTNADCGGGILHVYGEAVVPGAAYTVQVIEEHCNPADENDYSLAVILETAVFGDVLTSCNQIPCTPTGDGAHIIDVLGVLQRFGTQPGAPSKTRTEWEPSLLDLSPAITDVLYGVLGFQGVRYPSLGCSPGSGLCNGGSNANNSCTDDADCQLTPCPP